MMRDFKAKSRERGRGESKHNPSFFLRRKKLLMVAVLVFSFTFTASMAFAALTLNSTNITSDGALTLTPGNWTLTLPGTAGIVGQFLQTDGNGVTSWATMPISQWTTSGSDIFYNTGNVGIGTITPTAKLSINASGADTPPLVITTNGSPGNYTPSNSGIFIRDAAGQEMLRIFASDPDYANNFNSDNLYIGREAGFSQPADNIDAGFANVGIGSQTLRANTTGVTNVAVGNSALEDETTGFGNVAVGHGAGMEITTGSRNTTLGYFAGYLITTGRDNTIIGSSLDGIETGSGNTLIGNTSGLAADLSNHIILADGAGNQRLNIDDDGNVGIGQTIPTAILHLKAGTATAGTAPLKLASGVNLTTTEAGAIEYDGTHLYFTAADAGTRYQLDQQTGATGANTALSNLASVALNTDLVGAVAGGMGIRGGTAANDDLILEGTTSGTRTSSYVVMQPTAGSVGIGTATPATKLEVNGALRLSGTTSDSFVSPLGSSIPTKINIPVYDPGAFGQVLAMGLPASAATSERVITLADARAGEHQPSIMLLSPNEIQGMGMSFDGSNTIGSLKSSQALSFRVGGLTAGKEAVLIYQGGTVSINATSVASLSSLTGTVLNNPLAIAYPFVSGNYTPGLIFYSTDNNSTKPKAGIFIQDTASGSVLSFGTSNSYATGITNQALNIDHNGNVGIGTPTPSTDKLVVVGDIRVGTSGTNGCLSNFAGTVIAGTCSSDINLKQNIIPITGVLENYLRLRPITYEWRADEFPDRRFGRDRASGLIAQDVEQIFPELVGIDGQGFKTVDYGVALQMLSIEAIKEINLKVDLATFDTQSSGSSLDGFVSGLLTRVSAWMADAGNGIGDIFANVLNAKEKICVDSECLTKDDIRSLLLLARSQEVMTTPTPEPTPESLPEPEPEPTPDSTGLPQAEPTLPPLIPSEVEGETAPTPEPVPSLPDTGLTIPEESNPFTRFFQWLF